MKSENAENTKISLIQSKCYEESKDLMIDELQKNKVKEIFLGGFNIKNKDLDIIVSALDQNTSLEKFRANTITFEDQKSGLIKLVNSLLKNKSLKSLALNFLKIDSEVAKLIADELKNNHTLKSLNVSYNDINQQGLGYISDAIKTNKTLEELYLKGNTILCEKTYQLINYALLFEFKEAMVLNKKLVELEIQESSLLIEFLKDSNKSLAFFDSEVTNKCSDKLLGYKMHKTASIAIRGIKELADQKRFYIENHSIKQRDKFFHPEASERKKEFLRLIKKSLESIKNFGGESKEYSNYEYKTFSDKIKLLMHDLKIENAEKYCSRIDKISELSRLGNLKGKYKISANIMHYLFEFLTPEEIINEAMDAIIDWKKQIRPAAIQNDAEPHTTCDYYIAHEEDPYNNNQIKATGDIVQNFDYV